MGHGFKELREVFRKNSKFRNKEFIAYFGGSIDLKLAFRVEVLTKRQQLENTILHLQQEIDKGLIKINSLEQEVEIFTKLKRQINENKDFEYTVEENKVVKVDISGQGIYTTTCLVCNNTCHNNCAFANGADKARCIAMSPIGSCKICPQK